MPRKHRARKKAKSSKSTEAQALAASETPTPADSVAYAPHDPLYLEERRLLTAGAEANGERFDKYVISLAGGGLATSAIYVKEFIAPAAINSRPALIASWVLFLAAIAGGLISTFLCQRSREQFRDNLDTAYATGRPDWATQAHAMQSRRSIPNWIDRVNIMNLCLLALGCISLGIFVSNNIDNAVSNAPPRRSGAAATSTAPA